jgi:hypothetical protein
MSGEGAVSALAGLLIGLLAPDWAVRLLLPLVWGAGSCLYHARFSTMERRLFEEERHREGESRRRARLAFYGTKYRRAATLSLVFAVTGGLARQFAGG